MFNRVNFPETAQTNMDCNIYKDIMDQNEVVEIQARFLILEMLCQIQLKEKDGFWYHLPLRFISSLVQAVERILIPIYIGRLNSKTPSLKVAYYVSIALSMFILSYVNGLL